MNTFIVDHNDGGLKPLNCTDTFTVTSQVFWCRISLNQETVILYNNFLKDAWYSFDYASVPLSQVDLILSFETS